MEDGNLDSPFSRVDFYGRIGTDLISSSSGQWILAQPQPSLLIPPVGRDWIYELEVSAEDYEEIVGDETSNIVALGVSTEKGGSVAVSAVSTATATRTIRELETILALIERAPAVRPGPFSCGGPGMGDDLEVKVLPEPGRRDRREAQGVRREAYAERSVKRTRESTNRNRIRGAADRGERTTDREAPATKGKRRRSGDCAGKVIVLTRGGLA